MHHDADHTSERDDITGCARAAEDALRRLARLTIHRPSLTPADIDVVLADLAGAIAALPQAVTQFGDMLESSGYDFDLSMDTLTNADDASDAIGVARLHLDAVREPAVEVSRRLDAAHQQTAHIVAEDHVDDVAEYAAAARKRAEHREPPTQSSVAPPRGMDR